MANMFALILVIATLLTGIIWCIDRFKWARAPGKAGGGTGSGR